jgi:hypothetical protein
MCNSLCVNFKMGFAIKIIIHCTWCTSNFRVFLIMMCTCTLDYNKYIVRLFLVFYWTFVDFNRAQSYGLGMGH